MCFSYQPTGINTSSVDLLEVSFDLIWICANRYTVFIWNKIQKFTIVISFSPKTEYLKSLIDIEIVHIQLYLFMICPFLNNTIYYKLFTYNSCQVLYNVLSITLIKCVVSVFGKIRLYLSFAKSEKHGISNLHVAKLLRKAFYNSYLFTWSCQHNKFLA